MSLEKLSTRQLFTVFVISVATALFLTFLSLGEVYSAETTKTGKQVYDSLCVGCHGSGVLGAPVTGSADDWTEREQQGFETLQRHAIDGFNNMPAKGGDPTITNLEVIQAIAYMLTISGFDQYATLVGDGEPESRDTPLRVVQLAVEANPVKNVNRFNRLMKLQTERNLPPSKDGIHDPENESVGLLQSPKAAFEALPKSQSGNHVDWVKALSDGEISPRYDRIDPTLAPLVMDLNIVREIKGSMPNVVYPHKQHTEWLDCSNCHPAIFIPQKGANPLSMAAILLGKQCGVCHGTVAFPLSECRKCHSAHKPEQPPGG